MVIKPAGARPAPKKSAAVPIVIVLLVLIAGGAAAWWFVLRSTPEKAVRAFIQASERGDLDAVKETVTQASYADVERSKGLSLSAMSGRPASAEVKEGQDYSIGVATIDGDRARVPIKFRTEQATAAGSPQRDGLEIPIVTLREGNQWKVDWKETESAVVEAMFGVSVKSFEDALKRGREGIEAMMRGGTPPTPGR